MSLYTDLKAEYDAELARIDAGQYSADEVNALVNAAAYKFQSGVTKAKILCEIMGITFNEQEDGTTADEINDAQVACEEVSGWNMDYAVFTGDNEDATAPLQTWLQNKDQFYDQCNEYFMNLLFNMAIMKVDGAEYTLSDIYSPDDIPETSEDGSILIEDLDTLVQAAQRDIAQSVEDRESVVEYTSITDLRIADDSEDGELLLGNDHWYIDFALLNEQMDIDSNSLTPHSDRILQSAIVIES